MASHTSRRLVSAGTLLSAAAVLACVAGQVVGSPATRPSTQPVKPTQPPSLQQQFGNRAGNLAPGVGGEIGIPNLNVAPTPAPDGAGVDLVLLLDASNSMDGLIEQAKQQLWSVVRDFADVQRPDGDRPKLRVALFMYGNDGLPAAEGYVRQLVPLTDDLDAVSQALFALRTNGGSEYCGTVIDTAVRSLDWAQHPGSYRTIFIAGNEPFTQGPVAFGDAINGARSKQVVVNTIHCGHREQGVRGQWQTGATAGGGTFFNIDQDRAVPQIPCPQDPQLLKLNEKLNTTYLWYGKAELRRHFLENQLAQDANAEEYGLSNSADRAVAKASGAYFNRGRDLVDTYAEKPEELADALAEMDAELLPEAMQEMSAEERVAHVQAMAEARADLRAQIQTLAAEREVFLAEKLKEMGTETLGDAMRAAVQEQLKEAGFEKVEGEPAEAE